jgi:multiple sugar transport system substrate-binding protein
MKPRSLLSSLLVLGLTWFSTGCGSSGGGERRQGKLKIWTSHNNEEVQVFRELVAEFERDFAQRSGRPLQVEIGRVAHEGLETKLKSAALSHTTPDICRIDVAHVATLAWGSAAVRLDTSKSAFFQDLTRVRKHFVPAALASNLVPVPNGRGGFETGLYGVPDQTNCLVLFRNRALFRAKSKELRAAGLDPTLAPGTWEDFLRYGEVLADPDQSSFAFGMENTLWWSLPFLFSGGGDIFLPSNELVYSSALASPAAQSSYQYWVDLSRKEREVGGRKVTVEGGFWKGEANSGKSFLEGRLAMILSGPWNVPLFRTRIPEIAASLVPAGPAGSISTVGGSNLVILPTCVDREAALAFLEFVSSDDYQIRWAQRLGQIPVSVKALDEATRSADSLLRVFMKQMRTARARPTLPNFEPVENLFQGQMEAALRGYQTVPESLQKLNQKIEEEVLVPLREAL